MTKTIKISNTNKDGKTIKKSLKSVLENARENPEKQKKIDYLTAGIECFFASLSPEKYEKFINHPYYKDSIKNKIKSFIENEITIKDVHRSLYIEMFENDIYKKIEECKPSISEIQHAILEYYFEKK
jgi:hypothetical protein